MYLNIWYQPVLYRSFNMPLCGTYHKDMNKSELPWRKPLETNNINDDIKHHLVAKQVPRILLFYYSITLLQGSYNICTVLYIH
jgi:hypothetical protein